jgi:hypothetical protein
MSATGNWAVSRSLLLAQLDLETGAIPEARQLLTALSSVTAMSEDEKALLKELQQDLNAKTSKN